ncbi:MAG TPA: amino acid permease [Allosphingosinicella sp.]|jgi:APA family basic amino acid/polyamine antiporter
MGARTHRKRKLGPAMCVALVVGNMVGSGVFLLPASLAPLGWNSLYGWVATLAGTLCLTVVLTRLARDLGGGSGPFTYPAAAFGPAAGFVIAWSYWITTWVTNAALALAVVANLSVLWPGIGAAVVAPAIAVALIWLLVAVNCLGVRVAGDTQLVTTLLKLIPLLGAIGLAAWAISSGTVTVPAQDSVPITLGAINAAATLTLFPMLGFESAMAAGERVEDPRRTIPRATLIGTAIIGLVYILASSAVTMLLPAEDVAASNAPFSYFFTALIGPEVGALVALFAAIAALGALNGFTLLQGELLLGPARSGMFPRWFAAENRFESPYRMHLLSSGLASLLVLVNYTRGLAKLFEFMVLVTTSTTIIFYVAGTVAAMKLERAQRIGTSRGFLAVALAGLVYGFWAFYGAGLEASLWSVAMTAVGVPIYFVMRATVHSSPAAADGPAAPPGSAA